MNAGEWIGRNLDGDADIAVLGVPIHRASISPTNAHLTPAAVRESLARFSTWDGDHEVQLASLTVIDLGDIEGDDDDADPRAAHARVEEGVRIAFQRAPIVILLGGDNSLTRPAMRGAAGDELGSSWGLLTVDAHHDCRPLDGGPTNGTPVRGLISDGLPGDRVAQLGISGFANHEDHAAWALAQGVRVHRAAAIRAEGVKAIVDRALTVLAAAGTQHVYADLDIDALDRAFAPACPASMPGGLHPAEMLEAAYRLGASPLVRAMDLVEVDPSTDVAGQTVRMVAALLLSFCAGVARRRGR